MANKKRVHFNPYMQKAYNNKNKYEHEQAVQEYEKEKIMKQYNIKDEDEFQEWLKKNNNALRKRLKYHQNEIAIARFNDIENLITNAQSSVLLVNANTPKTSVKYKTPNNMINTYNRLNHDFFEYVREVARNGLKKEQTGTSLIKNTINLNGEMFYQYTNEDIAVPVYNMVEATENIWNKKRFAVLDLETIGGIDETGQQVLDNITEFSAGIANTETGELEKYYGSVIGISSRDKQRIVDLIHRYENGEKLSNRDMVTLKRIAKTGHPKTSVKEITDGIFEYVSFADDIDIKAMESDWMLSGAEQLYNIGQRQEATQIMYEGQKIFAWEKNRIEFFKTIRDNDLTLVGHNSGMFDLPMLNKQKLSKGARTVLSTLGLDNIRLDGRHLDTLAAIRVGEYGENWLDSLSNEDRKILKNNDLTHNQLETLVKKYVPNYYEGKTAHVGKTDIGATAEMLIKSGLFSTESQNYVFRKQQDNIHSKLLGDGSMLFYAKKSVGQHTNGTGALSFVQDAMTDDIRTFSGIKLNDNGAKKELFGQYGFQKGVSYTLDNIYEHEMTDEWVSTIQDVHPNVGERRIVTATFSPVTSSQSYKSKTPITLIGTREEIERTINQTLIHTADKDINGKWTTEFTKNNTKMLEAMEEIEFDQDGDIKTTAFSVKSQLRESTLRIENESAARSKREANIKKEANMLDFLNDMDSYIENAMDGNKTKKRASKARKRFLEIVKEKSKQISEGITNNTLNEKGVEMVKSFQEYFGWKDKTTGKYDVFRETVDAALASEKYSRSVRQTMSKIIEYAKKRGGNNEKLQAYYFQKYHEGLLSFAAQKSDDINKVTNTKPIRIRASDKSKFDIDISDYVKISKIHAPSNYTETDGIITLNLERSNLGLVDRLLKAKGYRNDISDTEKIKELKKFGDFLISSKIIKPNKKDKITVDKDTLETATQKIIENLKITRSKNQSAGRILIPQIQNVTTRLNKDNFGLTDEEIEYALINIDHSLPTMKLMSENTIDNEINYVVKNILFQHVDTDMLQKDGYSVEQAETFMRMRKVRMQDTEKFMSKFAHGLYDAGASLMYDKDSKDIYVLTNNGIQTKLDNLPYDEYSHGKFHTKIGTMKIVSPIGIYKKDYGNKLEFKTMIGKAGDQVGWMKSAFQRGVENGNVEEEAIRIVNALAGELRKSSSVMKGDMQDLRANGFFAIKEIIPEIQNLYEEGTFNGINFEEHEKFIKMLTGKTINADKLSYEQRTLISINANKILNAVSQKIGNGDLDYFASKFSFDNKNIQDFIGTVDNIEYSGDTYGSAKRGIAQQRSRTIYFNATQLREKALNGISIGRSLHTPTELAQAINRFDGLSFDTENTIRANRLAISTSDMRKMINAANGQNSEYIQTMLSSIHLEEGAAIASPALLDNVFNNRESTQKIILSKIVEKDLNTIELKQKTAPKIQISSDGKITFEYSNGVFVHRGENIVSKKGFNGTTEEVVAKEKGMLRFGAFINNILADQKSIEETLNSNTARTRVLNSNDKHQEIIKILNEVYSLNYYVDAFDSNPHRKIGESGASKNMTHFLAGGLGTSSDPKVTKTLNALGLGDVLYQVPKMEYIESLSEKDISKTALGAYIGNHKKEYVSHKEIVKIINENFGTVEEFKNALIEERNAPMKALEKILKDNGIIQEKETIHFISDNFTGEIKHKDPDIVIKRTVSQLMNVYDNDLDKVKSVLGDAIEGLEIRDGHFIHTNGSIDIDKLDQIIKKQIEDNPNFQTMRVGKNGEKVDVASVTLAAIEDHDRANYLIYGEKYGKGMKFTHRNMHMLEYERYDQQSIDKITEILGAEETHRIFGHVLDENNILRDEYIGTPITKGVADSVRDARYANPGEQLLVREGKIDNKAQKHLAQKGIDVNNVLKTIKQRGVKNVSTNYVENIYSASSMILAKDWNTGHSRNSFQNLIKNHGFRIETLNSLITSTGGNTHIDNQIYEKNTMLDLHIPELGDNQLYANESDRYIALPYTPKEWINKEIKEEAKEPFQQKVASLQKTYKKYIDYKSNGGADEETRSDLIAKMRTSIIDIKELISSSLSSKRGLLSHISEAVLPDAGLFKAHGIKLFGNETSSYYKALEFDGKNLVEEAAKGITEYDATFISREFFNNIYNEKYLKNLGISYEEMVSHVKKKGTLSFNVREPADYKKSDSISALYLSDTVTGNMALSTAILAETKHGDFDGDNTGIKILKGTAFIRDKNNKHYKRVTVDYASYNILKDKGVDIKLSKKAQRMFEDAVASEHYNAVVYNPLYKEPEKEIERNSLSTNDAHEYSTGGILRPINKKYNEQERQQLESIYENLSKLQEKEKTQNINDYRLALADYVKNNISDKATQDQYYEAIHYGISKEISRIDNIAKQRKAAAGEANHYLFRYRRMLEAVNAKDHTLVSNQDRGAIQKVVLAIQEGFLSPKNDTTSDVSMLENLKTAMNEMVGIGVKERSDEKIRSFLHTVLPERKEMKRLPIKTDGTMMNTEEAINSFVNFGSKIKLNNKAQSFFSQSVLIDGIGNDTPLYFTGDDIDVLDETLSDINNYYGTKDLKSPIIETNVVKMSEKSTPMTRATNKQESEGIIKLVSSASKNMTKFKSNGSLALGAVGLAGSIMMAGFIGGNPSKPVENQAQENHYDNYEIPRLSDNHLNNIRGGPKHGYVININAQTNQGQDYASEAIQQAINTGFNDTNVNISMNVKNFGQANTLDIYNMLSSAFSQ